MVTDQFDSTVSQNGSPWDNYLSRSFRNFCVAGIQNLHPNFDPLFRYIFPTTANTEDQSANPRLDIGSKIRNLAAIGFHSSDRYLTS